MPIPLGPVMKACSASVSVGLTHHLPGVVDAVSTAEPAPPPRRQGSHAHPVGAGDESTSKAYRLHVV